MADVLHDLDEIIRMLKRNDVNFDETFLYHFEPDVPVKEQVLNQSGINVSDGLFAHGIDYPTIESKQKPQSIFINLRYRLRGACTRAYVKKDTYDITINFDKKLIEIDDVLIKLYPNLRSDLKRLTYNVKVIKT